MILVDLLVQHYTIVLGHGERERERERATLRATPPRIMYQNDSYKGTRLEINANSNHEPSLFSIRETPGL